MESAFGRLAEPGSDRWASLSTMKAKYQEIGCVEGRYDNRGFRGSVRVLGW